MILENTFFTEVQLENGSLNEFVNKSWYALNIHQAYPEEKVGNNAFFDWARDLRWIKQDSIVLVIKGNIQKETREAINFLNEYWDEEVKELENAEKGKVVYFIIVG